MTTLAQAMDASRAAAEQRMALAKLLQADESRAGDLLDLCRRVKTASEADPVEYDKLIKTPEVNTLFARGALHFGRSQ